jgi:hypothetical protein
MTTDAVNLVGSAVPEPLPESLLKDLAEILSGDKAVYFRLEPEGAVLSVKSPRTQAFGESQDKWVRMTPEARARAVLGWIRRAAAYHRNPKACHPLHREAVA